MVARVYAGRHRAGGGSMNAKYVQSSYGSRAARSVRGRLRGPTARCPIAMRCRAYFDAAGSLPSRLSSSRSSLWRRTVVRKSADGLFRTFDPPSRDSEVTGSGLANDRCGRTMQQGTDCELGADLGRASTTRSARPHLRPVIYAIRFDTCPRMCTARLPHTP
jgi:hypothetical protein